MTNNLFTLAENCLFNADIEQKLTLTHHAQAQALAGTLDFQTLSPPQPIQLTRFPEHPIWQAPRHLAKRSLHTNEGRAAFFHALCHIEFIAIYLAWDILYRFRGLPEGFYRDWLKVADEEALHFDMLRTHLRNLGHDYGDFPVHGGLWAHAVDTEQDLLARLAIVPRCLEARGLDVTPGMIEHFKSQGDNVSCQLLQRILDDEIGHVAIGSTWFRYLCEQSQQDGEQVYQDRLARYFKGKPKGPFNRKLRIMAGFTEQELNWLEYDG
ncbi:MAG: ferritin-like domain-containing protein [Methylococcales bacterium]|nr:ferritin-like domain-containing protein [Methylococcales bacterium]